MQAAINTETLGLNPHCDRLCVAQLSNGDSTSAMVLRCVP
jgi:ribonuclease D